MADAIYARQSKDKKDSVSIESQIELSKRECSNPEQARIYIDRGYSGKNTLRPGFKRMVKDVKEGRITKVIVYRLDRLSRSIVDFGELWKVLEENKVEFVSVNEKFDTSTPMGRAMVYIIMVFAQLERETIAERVSDNYYSRIRYGSWPGGPAPYGMENTRIQNEEGRMVPSLKYDDNYQVVEEIFYQYALEETTLGSIARDLTIKGVVCNERKGWDSAALSRILHSPLYVKADQNIYWYYKSHGAIKFSNTIEEFTGVTSVHVVGKRTGNERKYTDLSDHVVSLTNFPGRIPSEVWLKCQEKLEKNKQIGNTGKGKHTWLSGLLKCGKCGYSLSVRVWKEKKYLNCSGRNNLHICEQKSFTIKPQEIEEAVQVEMEKLLKQCRKEPHKKSVFQSEVKKIQELYEIDKKIQRFIDQIAEGSEVTMKYINKELEVLDRKKKRILETDKEHEENLSGFNIVFDKLDFEEKKLSVQTFIEKISVFDDRIEIIWKV